MSINTAATTNGRAGRLVGIIVVFAGTIATVLALQNMLLWRFFPHLDRVTTDFSALYLQRELTSAPYRDAAVVFLGDSVLWGYHIRPEQSTVSILSSRGCNCENLSFKASSPPNYYALAKLMLHFHVRPQTVVIEANQKVLNQADNAYAALYPAVGDLVRSEGVLTGDEEKMLSVSPTAPAPFLAVISRVALMYGMRAEIRETWYGDVEPPLPKLNQNVLLGTYDLSPLDETNTGFLFLEKTVSTLRDAGVPIIAFTTPTNHALMHQFIDVPEYRANDAALVRMLRDHGARVLDLDTRFPANEFIDESHLTPAGQQHLARILGAALAATHSTPRL